MSEAWINFAIVIFVQFLLFIALASYQKELSNTKKLLGRGILIGIVFGLAFDLVLGKFLGVHSYLLGFGPLFLFLNAAISYGLFSATMLIFHATRLPYLFVWSFLVMAIYEITNQFFHVWTWELSFPSVLFVGVLSIGYFGGAVLVVSVGRISRH